MAITEALALGTPIVPTDPQQIIDVLPTNSDQSGLRALQQQWRDNPHDWSLLETLGARYLELAARSGDERYLGYAEQMLNRVASTPHPPAVDVLRARLLQRQHKFDAALAILDPLLLQHPRAGEAHLLAAYIQMARGDAAAALPHCAATLWISPLTALHCTARAQALSGDAHAAFAKLVQLQARADLGADERNEIMLTIAEIAERLGRDDIAQSQWQNLLQQQPEQTLVRLHLADLYLRTRRYQDCWNLLRENSQSGPLLLRQVLAARALHRDGAELLQQRLHNYFDIETLRNPDYASRDYANYLLNVDANADSALRVALNNWHTQREPDDALMVLQAAAPVHNNSAQVAPVRKWLQRTRLEDVRIAAIDHSAMAAR